MFAVDSRVLAEQAGTVRSANFAMLGAWVGAADAIDPASVERAIHEEFSGRKAKFIPSNVASFRAGIAAVEEQR